MRKPWQTCATCRYFAAFEDKLPGLDELVASGDGTCNYELPPVLGLHTLDVDKEYRIYPHSMRPTVEATDVACHHWTPYTAAKVDVDLAEPMVCGVAKSVDKV